MTIEKEMEGYLSFEETGYPSETTIIKETNLEILRWQGTPVLDIQYQSTKGTILIVLEDDFFSSLAASHLLGKEPLGGQRGITFRFIPHSALNRV